VVGREGNSYSLTDPQGELHGVKVPIHQLKIVTIPDETGDDIVEVLDIIDHLGPVGERMYLTRVKGEPEPIWMSSSQFNDVTIINDYHQRVSVASRTGVAVTPKRGRGRPRGRGNG